MRRVIRPLLIVALLLAVAWAAGPQASFGPSAEGLDAAGEAWSGLPLRALPAELARREAEAGVPAAHAARIVRAPGRTDSLRRTPWAIVYLPGFSATHAEGDPIHRETAARYGCHLVLARTAGHGFPDREESFADLSPAAWLASAAEAVALGRRLGDSVLVMGSSTGVTLALALAAERPEWVDAIVGYSPNIAVADPKASLLTAPWGLPLARLFHHGPYRDWSALASDSVRAHWTTRYRLEGVVAMQALVEETMTPDTWAEVRQPCFFGVWYADADHQDPVISVAAARKAFDALGTAQSRKRFVEWSGVEAHALASKHYSRDLDAVRADTRVFCEEVLGWRPVAVPLVREAD